MVLLLTLKENSCVTRLAGLTIFKFLYVVPEETLDPWRNFTLKKADFQLLAQKHTHTHKKTNSHQQRRGSGVGGQNGKKNKIVCCATSVVLTWPKEYFLFPWCLLVKICAGCGIIYLEGIIMLLFFHFFSFHLCNFRTTTKGHGCLSPHTLQF